MNKVQESKSEISRQLDGLKNATYSDNSDNSDNSENYDNSGNTDDIITEYEKTNTVKDIINKKLSNMEIYLNTKVINIYQRPWNKLEQKLKLRKLEQYYLNTDALEPPQQSKYSHLRDAYSITEAKQLLVSNRIKFKVVYDQDSCVIKSALVDVIIPAPAKP